MSYTVSAVCGSRPLRDFLGLPRAVYGEDPHWVPPVISTVRRTLDVNKNPYFRKASLKLFLCRKDKTPVARLAVVINRLEEKIFGLRSALFGYFEAMNDAEAVLHLFEEAERYCRLQGAQVLEGPFSPNHYSELGLQLDSFGAPPSFFQPYNPAYYPSLLEKAGYRLSRRFQTMKNDHIREYIRARYGLPPEPAGRHGYSVRSLSLKDLGEELERIREVNNDAFASNWHFLPLSREEYTFSSKYLSLVTRPDLIKIVEHRGRPVAVLHCVFDINPLLKKLKGRVGPVKYLKFLRARRKIKKLILFTVSIKKAYQHTQVYHLLLAAFCRMIPEFETLETTWLSPENIPALRAAESLGMKPDKHFAIYEKRIVP
jgi:hypothetical protein